MQNEVTIAKISNGFLVEWWSRGATETSSSESTNNKFTYATVEEALEKVKEVIGAL